MNLSSLSKCAALAFTIGIAPSAALSQVAAAGVRTGWLPFGSVTVGVGNVRGGDEFDDRGKIAVDATVGLARIGESRAAFVAALNVGEMAWRGGHDADCKFRTGGGCIPDAPELRYAALLVGLQGTASVVTATGLIGPGTVRIWNSGFQDTPTTVYGTLVRGEVWIQAVSHLQFGVTLSSRIVHSYERQRLNATSTSVGIRIYR